MDRDERIRACYLHCCLKWERTERMTNQSLRERFHIPQNKAYLVSGVIAAALEAGKIKPDEKVGTSKKHPITPEPLFCQAQLPRAKCKQISMLLFWRSQKTLVA